MVLNKLFEEKYNPGFLTKNQTLHMCAYLIGAHNASLEDVSDFCKLFSDKNDFPTKEEFADFTKHVEEQNQKNAEQLKKEG